MRRIKRESGKDSFELIPEKVGRLHDDRSYTYVMCSFYLQEKRLENIRNRKKLNSSDILSKLQVNPGKPIDKLFG